MLEPWPDYAGYQATPTARSRSWCSSDAEPVGDYDALDGDRLRRSSISPARSMPRAAAGSRPIRTRVPPLRETRTGPRGHRRTARGLHGRRLLPGSPVPEPAALVGVRLGHLRRGVPRRRVVRVEATARGHTRPDQRQHPLHGRRRAPALPRVRAAVVPAQACVVVDRTLGGGRDRRPARPHGAQRCRRSQRRVLLRDPVAHHHRELRRVGGGGARHPGGGHLRRSRHRSVHTHRAADRAEPDARSRATT